MVITVLMAVLSWELFGSTPIWRESFNGVVGDLSRAKEVSSDDMASFGLSGWSFETLRRMLSGELIVGWNEHKIGYLLSPAITGKVGKGSVLTVWARTRETASGVMPVAIVANGSTNYLGDVQLTATFANYTLDIDEDLTEGFAVLLTSITNRESAATIISDVAIWRNEEDVETLPPPDFERLCVDASVCRWHIDTSSLAQISSGKFTAKGAGISFLLDEELSTTVSYKDITKTTSKGVFVYTNALENTWFGFIPQGYENASNIHSAEARFCISNEMERLNAISLSFDIAQLDNTNSADKVTSIEIETRTVMAGGVADEWQKIGEYASVYNVTNTIDGIKPDFAATMTNMAFSVKKSVRRGGIAQIRLITRKRSTGREAVLGFRNINITTTADYGQFRLSIR